MKKIGEESKQHLEFVPGYFQVIRHISEKYGCDCGACRPGVRQASAPEGLVCFHASHCDGAKYYILF